MHKFGLALAFLFSTVSFCHAGSPVEDYFAAREQYVAKFAADPDAVANSDDVAKAYQDGLDDLQKRLIGILGPQKFKGLDEPPAFNGSLSEGDVDSGGMDGIRYGNADGSKTVVVSPLPVFQYWLKLAAAADSAPEAFHSGLDALLASDDFYTYGINNGAAFTNYVALPVTGKSPDEKIVAWLGIFAQDETGNTPPASIVIARISGDKIKLANITSTVEGTAIPTCDTAWTAATEKAETLQKQIEKDQIQDDPRWDEAMTLRSDADTAFRACFAKEAPNQPFFKQISKEAEDFVSLLKDK